MPLAIPKSKINRIWTKIDLDIPFKDIAKHEHFTVRLVQQINSNLPVPNVLKAFAKGVQQK